LKRTPSLAKDLLNKIPLTPEEHAKVSAFWRKLQWKIDGK